MSHPPLAATARPARPPACHAAAPSLTTKLRGNPDLHLAPRCGAHTRAGCTCRACRMHGGRSTGPRTPEGMARLRTARTVQGAYGAESRARNRYDLTALRRGQVGNAAVHHFDRLPPHLAARLMQIPSELMPPPPPSRGLTPAEDRAALRAEAAALAPWRAAIAQAGQATKATPAATASRPGISAEAYAPVLVLGNPAAAQDAPGSVHPDGAAKPHAPEHAADGRGTILAALPGAHGGPIQQQARPHAPDHAANRGGTIPAAAPATHGAPMQQSAIPHAPDHAANRGGTSPVAASATHGAPMQHSAKPHAPERGAPERGPAASDAILAALPNRAARRRWKSLQRHLPPAPATCSHP
jgi:hypothetical protein